MTKPTPSLARVAGTPAPPYYAVTTTTELGPAYDREEYLRLGSTLYETDLDAIREWRVHPLHSAAKARAKAGWFGPTITRIARVEADYGFNLPED